VTAQAQPSGERLISAWSDAQRSAAASVEGVRFREIAMRSVEGPALHHGIQTETIVERDGAGLRRRVVGAETHMGPVPPERLERMERRLDRSLGPGTEWTRTPALPALLAHARARGPAREIARDGHPAWEVEVSGVRTDAPRGGFDRGVLWFERRPGPVRLLAARFERRLPAGGHAVLVASFTRVAGLDLPLRHDAEAVVRQRRRVRWFTILVRGQADYVNHEVW
jgi:hypothetical protein